MSHHFQRPQRLNWPDLPMPTARVACLVYILLITYASTFPFNFNIGVGADAWDWIFAPIPRYITSFDIFTNILGYLPFGFLVVFAVYPKLRSYQAVLFAVLLGGLLSGLMESLQTWLSTRVPSNVDWWTNIGGATIGALLAVPMDPKWLSGSAFHHRRIQWFGPRSSGILLALSFPLAQIYPQPAWLAMGDWVDVWQTTTLWKETFNFATIEIVTTTVAWFASAICIALAMRDRAPKTTILFIILLITIFLKALFAGMQFGVDKSFVWLTPSAFWGMVGANILLVGALKLRRQWLYVLALISLSTMIFLVNFMPQSPYYMVSIQEWRHGRLIHFNHLISWLAWLWPVGAVLSLLKGLKPSSSI